MMPMDETERVSSLIGDIYDAALDPSSWPAVLQKTCAYVEGCAASLYSEDSVQRSGQFYFSWGDDPNYTTLYLEKYLALNPLVVPMMLTAKAGNVISAVGLMPQEEYFASRFYKEWAQPQGYLDSVHAVLDKSATRYAAVAVARHDSHGMTDDGARQRMQLLLPHFRRAVTIGKVIELHKVEAAALADTLDRLAAATFLVEGDARIVYANPSGEAMLSDGIVLRQSGPRLTAVDPHAHKVLLEAFTASSGGDLAIGTRGIAVPLTPHAATPFVAHILPLTSGARRRSGALYSAVAAMFVRKASLDLPHPLEAIATTYKLTPAEMRVLMAIVQIGGVPEVASVLGISETTVKTHLQHLFEKTGSNRQADLVKLVAGFMSPLT
jgi:DNA-binding CsgD family transcriptional regulator